MNQDKLFIKFILTKIILLMTIFAITSEIFLRKYVIRTDNIYLQSLLYKKRDSKNTVWGDSASQAAIYYLDDFLNLSSPADNYQEIEKKIKKYYLNINSGQVILHLSLNAFAKYRDRGIRKEDLKLYFSKWKPILFILEERFQIRLINYYESFIKNKFNLPNKFIYNDDGSASFSGIFEPPLEKRIDIYHQNYPKKFFENDKNYLAFIRIIDFLQTNNIKICFITAPWQKDFRENTMDMNRFTEIRNFYKNFAKKKEILYLDYLTYPFQTNNFYDGEHLNIEGSILFTSMVKESCEMH